MMTMVAEKRAGGWWWSPHRKTTLFPVWHRNPKESPRQLNRQAQTVKSPADLPGGRWYAYILYCNFRVEEMADMGVTATSVFVAEHTDLVDSSRQ
jgi:hypothetical protein